ncbi:hypothetical protein [Kordiimonas sp.]|uniref:hypothetical protein n=1 Tax=Kordiimonas sp. TaxID=1970157 RepID=UPI003A930617
MTVYGMVAFIVFIVMVSVVTMKVISAKAAGKSTQQKDDVANARIDALEERVRVLEKIATDKSSRLKDEIDAL